jgi:hypothetical protein
MSSKVAGQRFEARQILVGQASERQSLVADELL